MSFKIKINGKVHEVDVEKKVPLLWVLRDVLNMKGTKFGCGKGLCGACTVHIDGKAVRSCSLPISFAVDSEITTIEGISDNGDHPMQKAWLKHGVPQCGYCQPGQIMNAISLVNEKKGSLTDKDIDNGMSGNLCRCGTYQRIKKAIKEVANS